jgi:sulfatase modifying factor 1
VDADAINWPDMSGRSAVFSGFAISLLLASGCNGTSGDGNTEASYDDGTGLGAGECADVCGTPGCGSCPQVAMVDGGGFQIDATEVDNGQYAMMLEVEFDASVLPPGCDWKSGFQPAEWSDSLDPTLAVNNVDWCDAAVFCTWAGKRLCGAVDGGPADFEVADDPDADAWYRACSGAGATAYPYGPDYEPASCNGEDAGLDALQSVGTLATCEGGVTGLFDMSGSVWEWTDACEASPGDANTECRRRGGSRFSDGQSLRCDLNSGRERGERDNAIGFRCCSA